MTATFPGHFTTGGVTLLLHSLGEPSQFTLVTEITRGMTVRFKSTFKWIKWSLKNEDKGTHVTGTHNEDDDHNCTIICHHPCMKSQGSGFLEEISHHAGNANELSSSPGNRSWLTPSTSEFPCHLSVNCKSAVDKAGTD